MRSIMLLSGSDCVSLLFVHAVCVCWCSHCVFTRTAAILWSRSCVGQDRLGEEMKTNEQRCAKCSCSQLSYYLSAMPPSSSVFLPLSLLTSLSLRKYYKATQKDSQHSNEKHKSVPHLLLPSCHRQLILQGRLAKACGAIIPMLKPATMG